MRKFIEISAFAALLLTIVSCGASKKAAAVQEYVSEGEQKVAIPLSGPQYKTDAEYIRETASGVSRDMSTAKQIAVHEARQAIANTVQATVQNVIKSYLDHISSSSDVAGDEYRHFERMGVTVSDLCISGAELAGEELYRLADGSYRYHVCLQLNKADLAKEAAKEAEKEAEKAGNAALDEHKFNEKSFNDFFMEAIKMVK